MTRYDDPGLQDVLAGEYALGALHGAARRRFESLMRYRPDLRKRVAEWQNDITPLAAATAGVPPPRRLLRALEQRLDDPRRAAPGFWRGLGVAALALVLMVGAYVAWLGGGSTAGVQLPGYVAVLHDREQRPGVAIIAYTKPWRLAVTPLQALAAAPNRILRLWAFDAGTQTTTYVAPVAAATAPAPPLLAITADSLKEAETLLISLESAATPPGRQPAGPILYSGACIELPSAQDI